MYGIFSYDIASPRAGFRAGDRILDLSVVALLGYFDELGLDPAVFARPVLNDFIALGQPVWRAVGSRISQLLADDATALHDVREQVFIQASRAQLHLPVRIGDYTDFYAGIEHARNVGQIFRPDGEPLLPNYRHLPVAYHGRASSIVVSGTPIRRPSGQFLGPDGQPAFGPSRALDIELELGLIIGRNSTLGEPVPVHAAEDYIFGVVLFNDWSARDIQRWEYQPLGPFLGKNFGSSLSAWVLPFDALAPFRVAGMPQEPQPLPYLQHAQSGDATPGHAWPGVATPGVATPGHAWPGAFDIALEVLLNDVVVSRSNARHLYWSFAQMIAHHTVNGCNLCVGDVLATGTISGPEPGSYGSLLELTWGGKNPITLPDGTTRTYLQNGDRVTLRGRASRSNAGAAPEVVELGEVTGQIIG